MTSGILLRHNGNTGSLAVETIETSVSSALTLILRARIWVRSSCNYNMARLQGVLWGYEDAYNEARTELFSDIHTSHASELASQLITACLIPPHCGELTVLFHFISCVLSYCPHLSWQPLLPSSLIAITSHHYVHNLLSLLLGCEHTHSTV